MFRKLFRATWARLALRGAHYSDRKRQLNELYRIHDPWNMESEREQFRFAEVNRLIEATFGRVGTILEVGSGEGHHSRELINVCETLYGLDVSERAVHRARRRVPEATFGVGDLYACTLLERIPRVDLVVASEVLYYMKDVPRAVRRMSELGNKCLATYYDGRAAELDRVFEDMRLAGRSTFSIAETKWHAVWWTSEQGHGVRSMRPNTDANSERAGR